MVHGKIDTEGLSFKVTMDDVEALNQIAFDAKLDITKLSYHAYAFLTDKYVLLNSGSALGNGCGPLLISKKDVPIGNYRHFPEIINDWKIAIPGKFTTANFLLSIAFPLALNKKEMLYSEIEKSILADDFDAGLIIHENRFTYQSKGLNKIIDLGDYWEKLTGCPIPLGGIVINRIFPNEIQQKVSRVIRRSLEYAFSKPDASRDFIKKHSQEMADEVIQQHIELYVNDYSLDLGMKGKEAISQMFKLAEERKLIPESSQKLFLE